MKSFFKKIGKGLKKLGKGIMKVLNSKIGRIIGMVSLAFGVGKIFQAMYQGLTQGTAQAAAAGATGSGSGIVVEEGVSTAAQKAAAAQATEEAVKRTAEVSADIGAKISKDLGQQLNAKGSIAVDSLGEGVRVTQALVKNAPPTATGSMTTAVDSGFNSSIRNTIAETTSREIQYTAKDIVTQVPETATSAATTATTATPAPTVTTPVKSASLLEDPNVMKSALQGDAAQAISPETTILDTSASPSIMESALQGDAAKAVTSQALEPAMEAQIAEFKQLSPKKLADALKNPEQRTLYDSLVGPSQGLESAAGTSLQLTPSAQLPGVQEFTSFREAFQSGDNLLSGAGNVAERFMTYDLGELTKGKLTGYIGSRGAYNTATVTAGMLARAEEVEGPAGRNPYSAAISADLAAQGATTAYQPQTLAMDFSNQIATGNVTNPFTTLNNIRQKAGFGNLYGSLNSVASVVG